jgi:glycine reductase complex component B subunit alpha and beta
MPLEIAEFAVREIRFSPQFRYRGGVLEVDRDALVELVLRDARIQSARFEIVAPGDAVRVTGIRDLVEPRLKVGGSAQVFPGVLSPVVRVGEGLTHRLSGMAVLGCAAYEGTIRAGTGVQRSAILDMTGAGAAASRFSGLNHLVLITEISPGLAELEAHGAIQKAELEVALRLAETTRGMVPSKTEIFQSHAASRDLPRIALIQGCLTDAQQSHSGVSYYGLPLRETLTTAINPNELFDGAITVNTTRCVAYSPTTWDWQNHPLALALYRAQSAGRLNFAGVLLERIAFDNFHGKEVIAHNTAQLAEQMQVDAALITWTGSGNAFVEVMMTVRALEQRGIKTTLVTYEYGGKDGIDSPLLYYVPEATAAVSTGSRDRWIDLPEAEKIIGPYDEIKVLSYPGAPKTPARERFSLDARDMIVGGVDNWGGGDWVCEFF